MSPRRVAVLYGGISAERDISLKTGEAVMASLESLGLKAQGIDLGGDTLQQIMAINADLAFIALHGGMGEDGSLQAALEMRGLPYTGCGPLASGLAMDKVLCKRLWRGVALPTADFALLQPDSDWQAILTQLGGHVIVKPVSEGSSLGMSQAFTAEGLESAYALAAEYDRQVMAETWIEGREYSVGILGDEMLPVIELVTEDEFYTFDAKYHSAKTQYLCPAPIEARLAESLQALARDAFQSIGGRGWGRVDLMVDTDHQPWLLEVNTVPGLTSHSLVPMAAYQAGYSFDAMVDRILREVTA